MESKELNESKGTFLGTLFKYFNGLLIIDKSVDLVLIFVGLLAALGVESFQDSKAIEERYIDMLARTHDEILINNYLLEERKKSTLGFFEITSDINDMAASGNIKYYDGVNKILLLENSLFEIKVYQSILAEEFLNKTLYSEVLHLYDLLSKYADKMDITRENLKNYYYTYYRIFVKNSYQNKHLINEYIDINYLYNLITKSIPGLQSLGLDIELTSERLLKSFELELEKYETQIIKKRSIANYLTLSSAALGASKYQDAIRFSNEGSNRIKISVTDTINKDYSDDISYLGRFNQQLFRAKLLSVVYESGEYSKDEIKQHLDIYQNSRYADELSLVYYLDYYYYIDKNFEEFLVSLKKYVKAYPDCSELETRMFTYTDFTSKSELVEFMDISINENLNWREWLTKYVDPNNPK